MIGTEILKILYANDYQVVIFTRAKNKPEDGPRIIYSQWDWKKKIIDGDLLRSCDYIIHLAGANIAGRRWTRWYKKKIYDSRVKSAQLIIDTLNAGPSKTRAIIGASASGYYGEDGNILSSFSENSRPNNSFLGKLCNDLEKTLQQPTKNNIRTCIVRTGMVLSRRGGIFPRLRNQFWRNIIMVPGSGHQRVSWIHLNDLARFYAFCIQNEKMRGPINASTNDVVSMYGLMLRIEWAVGKNCLFLNIPSYMVRIALGGIASELLKSTTMNNTLIAHSGFTFRFKEIEECVFDLTRSYLSKIRNFDMTTGKIIK